MTDSSASFQTTIRDTAMNQGQRRIIEKSFCRSSQTEVQHVLIPAIRLCRYSIPHRRPLITERNSTKFREISCAVGQCASRSRTGGGSKSRWSCMDIRIYTWNVSTYTRSILLRQPKVKPLSKAMECFLRRPFCIWVIGMTTRL